jgi:magnesium transporter
MDCIVNCVAYTQGKRARELSIHEIGQACEHPDHFVWLGLNEPDEETLRAVQKQFGLHDLAIEDAHRAHQRPKIEHYGNSLFIVMRTVAKLPDSREIGFGETHLFVGENYVLSVRHGSTLSHVDVRRHCEANPALLKQGPGFVLYALMDFIVDQYFPVVQLLEDELEGLEDQVFAETFDRSVLEKVYRLKREILQVKHAISPLVDVSNQLTRFDLELIPESTRPYFRDIHDHVVRINEMLDNLRELLTAALEANLALVSVAQNDITKKLASWGGILAVPTLIAGVYGMNFENIPEYHIAYGYPLMILGSAAICLFLYWRFKRSGWL